MGGRRARLGNLPVRVSADKLLSLRDLDHSPRPVAGTPEGHRDLLPMALCAVADARRDGQPTKLAGAVIGIPNASATP